MIKATIVENGTGLTQTVARCAISDPGFRADLERIRQIPNQDRVWNVNQNVWLIFHPEQYEQILPEIGRALREYAVQPNLF